MASVSVPHLPYLSNPCDWFERLRPLGYGLLLDSSANIHTHSGQDKPLSGSGRYDIITAGPEQVTLVRNQRTYIYNPCDDSTVETCQPVFDVLAAQLEGLESGNVSHLPFAGGLAGFWGYELNSLLEPGRIAAPRASGRRFQTRYDGWPLSVGSYHRPP